MVRYPDTAVLITPGTPAWIEGKATFSAEVETTIICEIQPDSSNLSTTVNGKTVVAKYRLFFKNIYPSVSTARTVRIGTIEYNIIRPYITQLDVQMVIG